jgi:4-aminobutyrate aminotransferase
VNAAARAQLDRLQHTTTIHLTEPMIALAERLIAHAPGTLSRVFFCADGSGANEGAMTAARLATGRPDFLALRGGLHGRTAMTMAATGLPMWRADPFLPACVHLLPGPAEHDLAYQAGALNSALELVGSDRIAALIVEPIQGNGGIVVPPEGWFDAIVPILRAHGILLIVDEVQTGFCRTGRWFASEHWRVQPDLMSVAKAMTNGLPAAAWLATERVAQAFTRPAASTFGGNLVAMAAGLATIEVMERERLDLAATERGEQLRAGLRTIFAATPPVSEVRGRGLMIGVDLRDEGGAHDTPRCDALLWGLRRRGVLAGKTGPARNVLTFEPPLIITAEQVSDLLERVADAATESPMSPLTATIQEASHAMTATAAGERA